MSVGTKNDKGKAPLHFLIREFLEGTSHALEFGSKKYSAWNFTGGINYTRLTDAAQRHIIAFLSGEDLDPESGLPHLDHAAASLNMLKYMTVYKKEFDDRHKTHKQGNEKKDE